MELSRLEGNCQRRREHDCEKRKYNINRKPLLAFGGAVYNEITYFVDLIENETQLAYLEKKVYSTFSNRGSLRDSYASLGA